MKKNRQKKSSATKEKNQFIFSIQEKERAKISRDIHDSVIQDIRVIRLETENLKVFDESRNLQNKLEDIATDCIVKLRNICYNLAPAELMIHSEENSSKLELLSIINSLAQQFSSRTHIPCSVGVENDFEYPTEESSQNSKPRTYKKNVIMSFNAVQGCVIYDQSYDSNGYLESCQFHKKCEACGYVSNSNGQARGNLSTSYHCTQCGNNQAVEIVANFECVEVPYDN